MTNKHSKSGHDKTERTPELAILTPHRLQEVSGAVNNFTGKFAQIVRIRRQKLGLTQEELVSKLQTCGIKVSQGYISLLEAGQRKDPNVQLIVALALVLGFSLDEVLDSACRGNESD